jgi:hypothetical protein
MANGVASEEIPNSALLFRRIHRVFFDTETGHISSGAFDGQEMSVNWEQYANAEQTALQDSSANTVAVVSLLTDFCRGVEQSVVHDPNPENRAHALVRGRKSKPIKQKLRDAAVLVWQRKSSA